MTGAEHGVSALTGWEKGCAMYTPSPFSQWCFGLMSLLQRKLFRSLAATLTAYSLSKRVNSGVSRREFVPSDAVCCSGVRSGNRFSAQRVDARCNRLQVCRVCASRVPAQVIELKPLGDGTDEKVIGESMCSPNLSLKEDAAVSTIGASDPLPTRSASKGFASLLVQSIPQSDIERRMGSWLHRYFLKEKVVLRSKYNTTAVVNGTGAPTYTASGVKLKLGFIF